jgi:hypothetical protein
MWSETMRNQFLKLLTATILMLVATGAAQATETTFNAPSGTATVSTGVETGRSAAVKPQLTHIAKLAAVRMLSRSSRLPILAAHSEPG